MVLALLLLLQSFPVSRGKALVDALRTYDVERVDVAAALTPAGVAVTCTLEVKILRPGPLRFLLSLEARDLVLEGGTATLEGGAAAPAARFLGVRGVDLPGLLVLAPDPPPTPGETRRLELRYLWRPDGAGLAYAGAKRAQTHLSGFWLPAMAGETFAARVRVTGAPAVVATGRATAPGVYETARTPSVSFVAGAFAVTRRGGLALWLPPDAGAEPGPLLDDLAAVRAELARRFGPGPEAFTLVVEPRARPAPSYCGGGYAVVHAGWPRAGRDRWLAHLAHECAHDWWGYRITTPLLGGGGTWLREGLAEWAGVETAAALGADGTALWRARVRRYLGGADLRRAADGSLFANEPTLLDATYLDDPAVAYVRGALVLRLLAHATDGFEDALREIAAEPGDLDAKAFAARLDAARLVAYYAGTTRLPDFELDVGETGFRVRCRDPLWPGGRVPVAVTAGGSTRLVDVEIAGGWTDAAWNGPPPRAVEVDPERIWLDPIRGNSIWQRR